VEVLASRIAYQNAFEDILCSIAIESNRIAIFRNLWEAMWLLKCGTSACLFTIGRIELSVFEFTLFPKLPIELRTLVWEHIFLESRVIRVSEDTSRDPQTGPIGRRRVKATLTVPPALHVYRESRSIATKHYTMSFGTQLSGNGV